MKVITLDQDAFSQVCDKLQAKVSASFVPDLVIGIAQGGIYVANNVFDDIAHTYIKMQRPSTPAKDNNRWLMSIIKRLPLCVRDILRIIEAKMLAHRRHRGTPLTIDLGVFDDMKAQRILVIDDAIDSGLTMQSVLDALSRLSHKPDIRSAVITVTTRHPVVKPDYCLYNNQTLIRFPWSKDNAIHCDI